MMRPLSCTSFLAACIFFGGGSLPSAGGELDNNKNDENLRGGASSPSATHEAKQEEEADQRARKLTFGDDMDLGAPHKSSNGGQKRNSGLTGGVSITYELVSSGSSSSGSDYSTSGSRRIDYHNKLEAFYLENKYKSGHYIGARKVLVNPDYEVYQANDKADEEEEEENKPDDNDLLDFGKRKLQQQQKQHQGERKLQELFDDFDTKEPVPPPGGSTTQNAESDFTAEHITAYEYYYAYRGTINELNSGELLKFVYLPNYQLEFYNKNGDATGYCYEMNKNKQVYLEWCDSDKQEQKWVMGKAPLPFEEYEYYTISNIKHNYVLDYTTSNSYNLRGKDWSNWYDFYQHDEIDDVLFYKHSAYDKYDDYACRTSDGDRGESGRDYVTHEPTTRNACDDACNRDKRCQGYEYQSEYDRCEIWYAYIGEAHRADGADCYRKELYRIVDHHGNDDDDDDDDDDRAW